MSRPSKAKRRVEGIVLHLRDFQDSHRIVEFLTLEEGKLSLIARGARASRKRFTGILDRFNHLSAVVSPGRELWTVHEVSPVRLRLNLRRNLDAINRAHQMIEWCRMLSSEQDAAPNRFRFLNHALNLLDEGKLARAAGVYPRLLSDAGIMPTLGNCVHCRRSQENGFKGSLVSGKGFVCESCMKPTRRISPDAIRVFQGEWCEDTAVADEVEMTLSHWLQGELGRPLNVVRI